MKKKQKPTFLEKFLHWIGTPQSLIVHTIIFVLSLIASVFSERAMNAFTMLLSVEAIYMGILIQMTVNKSHKEIKGIGEDVEELSDDVEDILEDTEELTDPEEVSMPA